MIPSTLGLIKSTEKEMRFNFCYLLEWVKGEGGDKGGIKRSSFERSFFVIFQYPKTNHVGLWFSWESEVLIDSFYSSQV